jgi:hypothetical protein
MTDHRLAAEAVIDAYSFNPNRPNCAWGDLADAVEALADQLIPETTTPWNSTLTPMISAADIRAKAMAIAAEMRSITEPERQ